jgi:tripartite-type tricarboxylate transporter receptor subunit TctC
LQLLESAIQKILAQENVKKKLADLGMSSFFASRDDLTKQITKETAEWADVIKKAGVVLE